MTDPQPTKVSVTIDDPLYTLLLEVRDKVNSVDQKVNTLVSDSEDHEERIRELEKRKTVSPWQLWLAVGSGVTFLGGIVALLQNLTA